MSGHNGWGKKNHKNHNNNHNKTIKCVVKGGRIQYAEKEGNDGIIHTSIVHINS